MRLKKRLHPGKSKRKTMSYIHVRYVDRRVNYALVVVSLHIADAIIKGWIGINISGNVKVRRPQRNDALDH